MKADRHTKKSPLRDRSRIFLSLLLLGSIFAARAGANPTGPAVVAGGASVSGIGTPDVTVQQTTHQTVLHWQQFNIAPNEITQFIQPSAQSIALNRIFDANPSQILGTLQANGSVILLNPNGVLFGRGAQVNVNGLIASSLNLTDGDFMAGRFRFEGSDLNGSIRNAGAIETGTGGFVYLLAPNVENSGVIQSPEGEIVLAAGRSAYLSNRPDGRGFLVEVTAPAGETVNLGDLIADGGKISLFGRVVNQSGLIQANSVRERNGRIELFASRKLDLAEGSRTVARGSDRGISAGGTVLAISDKQAGEARLNAGALIDVSGGAAGGEGGFAEISGRRVALGGRVLADAVRGFRGGKFLLDPFDLTVDSAFLEQLLTNVAAQRIEIQADHDITVTASLDEAIFLPNRPAGSGATERTLDFQAGNDLRFDSVFLWSPNEASGLRWNIRGKAGNDIIFTRANLRLGNGGEFDFEAGRDILLETDPATGIASYLWTESGSALIGNQPVDVPGGNIRLKAGRDIVAASILDTINGVNRYSGIRLAGESTELSVPSGDLTIEAGRDFLGGFVLANGSASISAGGNLGRSSAGRYPDQHPDFNYSNLLLGKGTVQIDAGKSIYLGRVQDIGLAEADKAILHPENSVILTAEKGDIHLNPFPKAGLFGADGSNFYPAFFTARAKEGSILIERDLTFWPSLNGVLDFSARQAIQGSAAATGQLTKVLLANGNPGNLPGINTSQVRGAAREESFDPSLPDLSDSDRDKRGAVRFATELGDISGLRFLFKTGLKKNVTIHSGRDLNKMTAHLMIEEGTETLVRAERDISLNLIREAGRDIESGIFFYGTGTGRVYAGRDLDLGDSNGIEQRLPFGIGKVPSGLIDISVGRNLRMTTSKIYTYNGASLSIHGIGGPGSAIGGVVDVGTNDRGSSTSLDRGIATVGGGSIDLTAEGDVNVNSSRVATFGGGDIRITSTRGDINAGFGAAEDTVVVAVPMVTVDSDGKIVTTQRLVRVPGSGIFTFHDSDPSPLPPYPPAPPVLLPPREKTAEMARLESEMIKRSLLGQDISAWQAAFEAEVKRSDEAYQLEAQRVVSEAAQRYEETKAEFRKEWKLGDIDLKAKEGAVVVPPAGIRGKKITIEANRLVIEGGVISGDVDIDVGAVVGGLEGLAGPITGNVGANTVVSISLPSIPTGGGAGSAGLGGLSGSTGSLSAASSGGVTAASKAVQTVQETISEKTEAAEEPEEEMIASAAPQEEKTEEKPSKTRTGVKKGRRGGRGFTGFQIKRGVVIEVEVHEDPG